MNLSLFIHIQKEWGLSREVIMTLSISYKTRLYVHQPRTVPWLDIKTRKKNTEMW